MVHTNGTRSEGYIVTHQCDEGQSCLACFSWERWNAVMIHETTTILSELSSSGAYMDR